MKWLRRAFDLFFVLIVGFVGFQRYAIWKKEAVVEARTFAPEQYSTFNGERQALFIAEKKRVVVFWATWCGPCRMELSRIQSLINKGSVRADSILALSLQEEAGLVEKTVKDRGYSFAVGLDPDGRIAEKFSVSVTPTLLYINGFSVERMTSGLSLLLERSLQKFFAQP